MVMKEACDRDVIETVVNDSKPSNVIPPCSVSKFGATRPVIFDPLSTENEPLISSTLLKVMVPLAEDEIVTLPCKVSQLVRLLASL